jgi:L-threonylcarbamoyladenylate synthase
VTARVVPDDPAGRETAVDVLRGGGIVAVPTDTVYGIAVALHTPGGIERLFHAKARPPDKGIVLLLDGVAQARHLGVMGPAAEALAAACWPGGLTLVVPQRPGVRLPAILTAGSPTIGLRVPDHDAPRALARDLGPLPVTSANISGRPEGRDATEIDALFGDSIELVIDGGPAHGGPASTVVDATGDRPRIIRPGAVPLPRLVEILEAAGIGHDLASA